MMNQLQSQGYMGDKGPVNVWGMPMAPPPEFYQLPEAEPSLLDQMGGGGGGGMSFRMGGGGAPSQLATTLDWAAQQPLPKQELKLATDQYAARYGDEIWKTIDKPWLEQNLPGTNWDTQKALIEANTQNYYDTGDLWGPSSPVKKLIAGPSGLDKIMAAAKPTYSTKGDYGIGMSNASKVGSIWKPSYAGGFGGF